MDGTMPWVCRVWIDSSSVYLQVLYDDDETETERGLWWDCTNHGWAVEQSVGKTYEAGFLSDAHTYRVEIWSFKESGGSWTIIPRLFIDGVPVITLDPIKGSVYDASYLVPFLAARDGSLYLLNYEVSTFV
jgi:hypothetical protein